MAAPVLFSSLFALWTWCSGQTESFTVFAEQMRENAKLTRTFISRGSMGIDKWWMFFKMAATAWLMVLGYWGVYQFSPGRKNIHNTAAPVPTAEETEKTTGTGADVASPLVPRRSITRRMMKNRYQNRDLFLANLQNRLLKTIRQLRMTSNRAKPRM